MLKVAILDDYQNVSQEFVDLKKLSGKYEFKIFSEPFEDEADALDKLADLGLQQGWALFYGGTSLLIMVGVAIDTIQQVNAYLLNRHYDGLMTTGNKRKG